MARSKQKLNNKYWESVKLMKTVIEKSTQPIAHLF
jgi:hypothetical protein